MLRKVKSLQRRAAPAPSAPASTSCRGTDSRRCSSVWSPLAPFAPQKPSRPKVCPQAPMPACRMSELRSVKLCELKIFCGHAGAHDVGDAGRELAVLDQDVLHIVAGTHQVGLGVAVPVALHGKHVVGGADEGVAHHGVAAAEPVHAVLVGVAGIAADHAQIVERESGGILHLDRPGARADDAGEAVDLHVARFERADAVPVRLLHPAFVGVRVLRAVVDNGSAAQDLHVLHIATDSGCRR